MNKKNIDYDKLQNKIQEIIVLKPHGTASREIIDIIKKMNNDEATAADVSHGKAFNS